ncbi:hypothetical protein PO909_024720 [Leuciscus waleckii]
MCINTGKPVVKVKPDQRVFRGETVTLTCDIQGGRNIQWRYSWFRDGDTVYPYTTPTSAEFSFTADRVSVSKYRCRGERSGSHTDFSDAVTLTVSVSPKAVLTVRPDERVFRGETVTLRCDIKWGGDTGWTYRWEIEGTNNWDRNSANRCTEQDCCTSGADKQTHRNAS